MKRVIYFCIISILLYGCVHELGETSKVESIYYDGDNKAGLNLVKKLDEQNQKEKLEKILELKDVRLVLDHTCFGIGFREGLHYLVPVQNRETGVINGCLIYKITDDKRESSESIKLSGELHLIDQKEYDALPYEFQAMRSVFFQKWQNEGLTVESSLCMPRQDFTKSKTVNNGDVIIENSVARAVDLLGPAYLSHIDYYIEIENGIIDGESVIYGVSYETRKEIFLRNGRFLVQRIQTSKIPDIIVEMEWVEIILNTHGPLTEKKYSDVLQAYMNKCKDFFRTKAGVVNVYYTIHLLGGSGSSSGGSSGGSGGSGSSGSTSGEYEHTEAELAELGIDLETFQLDPYDEYKKLTQDEVILIMRFPLQALEIRKNAGIAEKETKAIFGKNGRHDKSDAFRHCYFNILNSISCGVVLARRFGNAHEERSDQSALEKRMDLHNNKVGYDIFKKYSGLDKRSASDKAMDALNNGDLLYEKNGELIPTNQ
ncbi:hypothetical protein [uncultured Sanguibacteroides sp.]|uniref:DUF6973 domain-containing protein n=1 Tax=uncultured Sanguibacteroides sp. TaxID=1635151 RepID=UPI0025FA518B|nr:hypothetical protein [uncultured Sanguibacteroides sp.]